MEIICEFGQLSTELESNGFIDEPIIAFVEDRIDMGYFSSATEALRKEFDASIRVPGCRLWNQVTVDTIVKLELPDRFFDKTKASKCKSIW